MLKLFVIFRVIELMLNNCAVIWINSSSAWQQIKNPGSAFQLFCFFLVIFFIYVPSLKSYSMKSIYLCTNQIGFYSNWHCKSFIPCCRSNVSFTGWFWEGVGSDNGQGEEQHANWRQNLIAHLASRQTAMTPDGPVVHCRSSGAISYWARKQMLIVVWNQKRTLMSTRSSLTYY